MLKPLRILHHYELRTYAIHLPLREKYPQFLIQILYHFLQFEDPQKRYEKFQFFFCVNDMDVFVLVIE